MPRINDQEVWLRAYTAIVNGYASLYGHRIDINVVSMNQAIKFADQALKDFNDKFPSFDFASNEGKEKYNTDGSLPSTPTQK